MIFSELLSLCLLTALFSACLMVCFDKWHLLDYYSWRKKSWMPDRCDFCFGFWLSFLMLTVSTIWLPFYVILLAFPAAAVTRKLLI